MSENVSLVNIKNNGGDLKKSIIDSLELIDFKLKKTNEILIKPNLSYYWKSNTGYTTDPKIISSLIDVIREYYGFDYNIKIIESDASAMRVKYSFNMLGYVNLAKEKNVELFNLSDDDEVKKEFYINDKKISLSFPQVLLNNNVFINVPKLKVIGITKVTCAMKNLFGCLTTRRKYKYHNNINEIIVSIYKTIKPDLNIVDGIVALGKNPYKLNLIMAGMDSFYIDWVASKIYGYNPTSIKYLKMLEKEKNINQLNLLGEDINYFLNQMDSPNAMISTWGNKLQLRLLWLYANIMGDVIPPFLEDYDD